MYIELLEKNFQQVSLQLCQTQQLLLKKNTQEQNFRQNYHVISKLKEEQTPLRGKLQQLLMKKDKNDKSLEEINTIIDALRVKQSNNGTDRQSILKFLYNLIYENVLPQSSQYLLKIATQDLDIFDQSHQQTQRKIEQDGENSIDTNNLLLSLNLSPNQLQSLQGYKPQLVHQYQQFKIVMENLETVKTQIYKQSQEFQLTLDKFRDELDSEQAGKFILKFLNKNCTNDDYVQDGKPKLFFKRKSSDLSSIKLEDMQDEQQLNRITKKIHLDNKGDFPN